MLKNKKLLIIASTLFAITEIVLSVIIQKSHGDVNRYVSYFSVCLACLFAVLFIEDTWKYRMTQLALIMTVLADYFLVMMADLQQFPAMVFFSVAQLAYFNRIFVTSDRRLERICHVAVRCCTVVFALALTLIVLGRKADAVSIVSMFYFANLVSNIIFSFVQFKKNYLLAIGLLLFSCCDILIGFSFLENYIEIKPGSLAYKLAHPGGNFAWMFYVPSQTFIALSLLPERLKKIKASHRVMEATQ